MKRRVKTALGLDLGADGVRVALVERDEQGFRTVAAAHGAWPAAARPPETGGGKVLARVLAQLGRRAQVRRAPVAVALSADSLVMQLLELPKHVPTNIGEFVQSELQQYVALSGKNVISDFCGVGIGAAKRVLAVAADTDEVQAQVAACGGAGLAVDVVEPAALAYARAFFGPGSRTQHNGDAVIALLGPRTLTIHLFLRRTLDFIRIRNLPQDAPTPAALCAWLGEELRAVARYGQTAGWGAPHGHAEGAASSTLPWQVVIHDGTHKASEIGPLLAAQAGIETLTVVDACASPLGAATAPNEDACQVAVGAALALLDAEDSLKINLLPPAVTEARSLSQHVLATALVAVVVFLGIFAATHWLTRTAQALDRKIAQTRITQELYTTPALMTEEKFLDREIERLGHRAAPLRQALAGRHEADWPGILAAVRQAAPAGVSIAQVQSSDGGTVVLKGATPSCSAARTFVQNLENQSPFALVSLALVQQKQDTDNRWEYRIDCVLKAKTRVEGVSPLKRGQEARDTAQGGESS